MAGQSGSQGWWERAWASGPAIRHRLGEAALAWLDALFPPRCAGCGRLGSHFCPRCVASLALLTPPWCDLCGQRLPAPGRCAECRAAPPPLVIRSAAVLQGPLRRAIHQLKYRGQTAAARDLAALLVEPARALLEGAAASDSRGHGTEGTPPWVGAPLGAGVALWTGGRWGQEKRPVVVPVPLHPARERERGYNQAALLARHLAAALDLPYDGRWLRRERPTASQVGLSRRGRRDNVQGAFAAAPRPATATRPVLLVDDVVTTGSTLASAARACVAAGVPRVYGVTLARER